MTTRAWLSSHLPKATFLAAGSPLSFAEQELQVLAQAERQRQRWVPVTSILHIMSDMNEPILSALLGAFSASQPRPDLMVVDTLTTAAVDAAEKLGVPVMLNNPLPMWHDLAEPQVCVHVCAFEAPVRAVPGCPGLSTPPPHPPTPCNAPAELKSIPDCVSHQPACNVHRASSCRSTPTRGRCRACVPSAAAWGTSLST